MALTAEERARRKPYLGASQAAGVLGLDPFKSPTAVYWDCVADVPDESTSSTRAGDFLEEAICMYGAERLGVELVRKQHVVCADGPGAGVLAASFDALIVGRDNEAIEAKYTSLHREWGDEGSDGVPERVVVQTQTQMAVKPSLERVWVPALILGRNAEFRLYCVNRSDELIDMIVPRLVSFWQSHVMAKVPPDGDFAPPLAVLKALRREQGIIQLDDQAVTAWSVYDAAKTACRDAEAAVEDAKRHVLAHLGEAECGRLPDGRTISFYSQKSAPRVDTAKLRALAPELYGQIVSQGTHRVLRIKE